MKTRIFAAQVVKGLKRSGLRFLLPCAGSIPAWWRFSGKYHASPYQLILPGEFKWHIDGQVQLHVKSADKFSDLISDDKPCTFIL